VREPELAASVRNADLARVEMAGEDEVESTCRQLVDHVREMAEQDPKIRVGICKPLGPRLALSIRARVDADDLHPTAPELHRPRFVDQESRRAELDEVAGLRKGVPRDREVVVPEHRK
jgi:hypothetical protein